MNVLDLFCGAGGFSTGFSQAGYDILAGVDNNEDALESYEKNHDTSGHNIDLAEADATEILEETGVDTNEIDGIIGGPPCQGFSNAGERDPDDPRNKLVFNYFDLIGEIEPEFFVMENVRGILFDRNSHVIEYIKDRADELGYNLEYEVLNAANYGVPQTRKRVILIGMKDHEPEHPEPIYSEDDWVGVRDVIGDKVEEHTTDGQVVSSYGTQETLRGERNTRSLDQPCYTIRATRALVDIIPSDYDPDDYDGVPSITDVREYRFDEEDAAQIQSFPEGYEFTGTLTEQRRQIGNAVPPKMAKAVAEQIKDTLDD